MFNLYNINMKVYHTLKPIYNKDSKILILGSMPSVKSRELNFYYAHPQNRFWKILETVFKTNIDETNEARTKFLITNKIALFDVIKECDITSSSDASIKNPIPNDFTKIIKNSNIKYIFTTGKKAYDLYNKLCFEKTNIKAICLPSPSAANAKMKLETLSKEYQIIKDILEKEKD